MFSTNLLAQVATGNELSLNILENSLNFYQVTGESWDRMWDLIVNPIHDFFIC
jgi:hypothetical protein